MGPEGRLADAYLVFKQPGGPVETGAKRGNPLPIDTSGSAGEFAERTQMSRDLVPNARDHHAVGLMLVLGAGLGAVIGAAIGAGAGDVAGWVVMGLPAGASVGLAIGAVFSKPGPRPEAMAPRWMTAEDDGPSFATAAPVHDRPHPDPSRRPAA
jgi:hypothetical protein